MKKDNSEDEQDVRYLKDLTVFEVSPVLVGANQDTYTMAIKSNKELLEEMVKDGTEKTENEIKKLTKASIRCIPLKNQQDGACVFSGNYSKQRVLFAKAY